MDMDVLGNFIDGKFIATSHHLDSFCPATGEVYLRVPDSGAEEVELAVRAAKAAFQR